MRRSRRPAGNGLRSQYVIHRFRRLTGRGRVGELLVIPAQAWAGGLIAAVVIGALAGLLPAIRAARLSPTRALWSL